MGQRSDFNNTACERAYCAEPCGRDGCSAEQAGGHLFEGKDEEVRHKTLLAEAHSVLDEVESIHKPKARYALFSGGHDSLTTTAVAMEWALERDLAMRVAHINTGIGVPETRDFVREVCDHQGWPLDEFHPPVSYEAIVREYGFPGPANHGLMYQRLKERCLRQLVRESKGDHVMNRVMLVTGVRAEESQRRMRHVERTQRIDAQCWAAALWNWTKLDCVHEMQRRGLPRNPVVDKLHMSGECLCGAFARPGEIEELELWYPEVAERIHALERVVAEDGHRAYVWGVRPPKVHREQMSMILDEYEQAEAGPLCVACEDVAQ